MQACREHIRALDRRSAAHCGLLWDMGLKQLLDSGDDKRALLGDIVAAAGNCHDVYRLAYERWRASLTQHKMDVFQVKGRFVTGLGLKNALETGLRLQHTYGVPILPGSGLKGLCRHFCNEVWGLSDAAFRAGGEFDQLLFGTTSQQGLAEFEDAWMVPESLKSSPLQPDVMTVHQRGYYADASRPAAPDGASHPVPVPFLSVRGRFLVAIRVDGERESAGPWMDAAFQLCKDALEYWGAGGKTSSGYGRMVPVVAR